MTYRIAMLAAVAAAVLCATAAEAKPVNTVQAGELVIDPPMLINLGFEWLASGDDNRNARSEDFDFSLKPGSAAIGKAAVIPNVTDGYAGAAPDLGALEYRKPAPHYGPRT